MSTIKDITAGIRWHSAKSKVNNAVSVFAKHGLGFSLSEGIIGSVSDLSKSEQKRITAAADVMQKNTAAFYTTRQKFDNKTVVRTAHYEPLNVADYSIAQEMAKKQASSSPKLRAALKFAQRIVFDAKIQAYPNRYVLGLDAEAMQEWTSRTESLWNLEKDLKDWDESRVDSLPQIADLAFWMYRELNEFFCIIRYYSNDDTRITGVSLQLINPYQVQSPDFTGYYSYQIYDCASTVLVNSARYLSNMPDGNYIDGGIEFSAKGEELAIFIAPDNIGEPWIRIPVKTESGLTQIMHGFIKSSPGQKRGIPDGAYNWHEYAKINDLERFEMDSARTNSMIAGTVTSDSNATPGGLNPMNDIGWKKLEGEEAPSGYNPPQYDVREVNGAGFIVQNFTPGYKYNPLDTSRPNLNIPQFIDSRLEYMFPSDSGLSVVTVKQRFDGSYNASKGAIDLSWKNGIEYFLKNFESDFYRPAYNAWLNAKIASGYVTAPGWQKRYNKIAWSDMQVITPPKPSLNPFAEAKASELNTKNLFSNAEREAQQISGTSAIDNAERAVIVNRAKIESEAPIREAQKELDKAKYNPQTEGGESDE